MDFENTRIDGCVIVKPKVFQDHRGLFIKTFQKSVFEDQGFDCEFDEDFYSFSAKDVVRGMHFQIPPQDHAKYVTCIEGGIVDVILDIRKNSKSYGEFVAVELNAENAWGMYVPKGCAHGFASLKKRSCVYYKVGTEHNASHDSGILWNSFGFQWPCAIPVISSRDQSFPTFKDYSSPFS